jgi:hypothetical protein
LAGKVGVIVVVRAAWVTWASTTTCRAGVGADLPTHLAAYACGLASVAFEVRPPTLGTSKRHRPCMGARSGSRRRGGRRGNRRRHFRLLPSECCSRFEVADEKPEAIGEVLMVYLICTMASQRGPFGRRLHRRWKRTDYPASFPCH